MTARRRCPPGGTIGEGPSRTTWARRSGRGQGVGPPTARPEPRAWTGLGDAGDYGRWNGSGFGRGVPKERGCNWDQRSRDPGRMGVVARARPVDFGSEVEPSREAVWCSNASLIGPGGCWCWRRRKRACSTTASSAPSTSFWGSSTRARASRPRRSSSSGSRSRRCARRSRRPSACRARPRPGRRRSRPGRRRSSSCRCARPCSSATTTSAPSTCSSASSARARAWPPRCS